MDSVILHAPPLCVLFGAALLGIVLSRLCRRGSMALAIFSQGAAVALTLWALVLGAATQEVVTALLALVLASLLRLPHKGRRDV